MCAKQTKVGIDIQGMFDGLLDRAPYEVAADIIERKLKDNGVAITDKERDTLIHQLRSGHFKPIRRRGWRFWDRKTVTIVVSDADIAEIERRVKKFHDGIPEMGIGLIESLSPKLMELVKNGWFKQSLKREMQFSDQFTRDVWATWHQPLELLWLVIDMACRCAENISHLANQEETDEPHLREAMVRLHTRGVRIAKEILTLLGNGFADGAGARCPLCQ